MSDNRPAAVFLDRDGTINQRAAEHEYIPSWEEFRWLPGALEGLVRLAQAHLPLIVVSNQRGVSSGRVTAAGLRSIERGIQSALSPHKGRIELFMYCTHAIEERCECRKPKPGLLLEAARELGLDLPRCWMIGDCEDDVEAGLAAGCRVVRIASTPSSRVPTVKSLLDAAEFVVGQPT